MTLHRTPNTSYFAVQRIAEHFGGYAKAAAVLGYKQSNLRDWGYEQTTSCPTWAQAVALDAAYHAAGGEGAPLLEAYAAQLDRSVNTLTACHAELAKDLAEASREFGEAWAAATALIVPGHSPNAVQHALIELDQAETLFSRLHRRIFSFRRSGTVPGLPGGAQ